MGQRIWAGDTDTFKISTSSGIRFHIFRNRGRIRIHCRQPVVICVCLDDYQDVQACLYNKGAVFRFGNHWDSHHIHVTYLCKHCHDYWAHSCQGATASIYQLRWKFSFKQFYHAWACPELWKQDWGMTLFISLLFY